MKKTSKIILVSLVGAVLCNLANAAIDPVKLKKKCLKKADNYWVEKTNECISKDPCFKVTDNSATLQMSPYCFTDLGRDDSRLREKYIQEVLKTGIKTENSITHQILGYDAKKVYVYELTDGGYIAFPQGVTFYSNDKFAALKDTCVAYGYKLTSCDGNNSYCCENVSSSEKCTEMGNFASTVFEMTCSGSLVDENCDIVCE